MGAVTPAISPMGIWQWMILRLVNSKAPWKTRKFSLHQCSRSLSSWSRWTPLGVYGCLTANMKVTKSQSKPKPSSPRGALGKRASVTKPFMGSSPVMKNLHWCLWIWVESLRKETLLSNFANTADFSTPKYDRCKTDTSLKGTVELVPALRRLQSCWLTLFD